MTSIEGSRPYRLLITGSRTWGTPFAVWVHLDAHTGDICEDGILLDDLVIVHGACPDSPDQYAQEWATLHHVRTEPHPADWATDGRLAGIARNTRMVAAGADHCIAFLRPCTRPGCPRPEPHDTHGADHCTTAARRAGIPTTYIRECPS